MNRFKRRLAYQFVFLLILAAIPAAAQTPATIAISFSPSTVLLNGNSTQTITITNPNAFSINNVSFSDVEPAGITLITQTGGTCSTLATGGGMFSINPGTGTFSSTSNTLAAGQSCNITVLVRGAALGAFLNTTSTVTANVAPGGPASATLTVTATSVVPAPPSLTLVVTGLLSLLAWWLLRSRRTASLI
jgi:uncharacterized repeat protein (TIGR01451 family)